MTPKRVREWWKPMEEPAEWVCHFCGHEFLLNEIFETADEFAYCADCKAKILAKPKQELEQ